MTLESKIQWAKDEISHIERDIEIKAQFLELAKERLKLKKEQLAHYEGERDKKIAETFEKSMEDVLEKSKKTFEFLAGK